MPTPGRLLRLGQVPAGKFEEPTYKIFPWSRSSSIAAQISSQGVFLSM